MFSWLPDSVPASLFLCHCVSSLIAGLSGGIDLSNKITKLSNCFIDWLSLLSLSFAFSLFLLSFYSLHSLSLFAALLYLQLSHPLSIFPSPPLSPRSALFSLAVFHLHPFTTGRQTCPPEKFDCGGAASKCVSLSWRCDGERDCENGADEEQCAAGRFVVGGGNVGWRGAGWNDRTVSTHHSLRAEA